MKTCQDYEMDLLHKASGDYQYIKYKAALEQHLKKCHVCRKVYKILVQIDALVRDAEVDKKIPKLNKGNAALLNPVRSEHSQSIKTVASLKSPPQTPIGGSASGTDLHWTLLSGMNLV